MKRLITLLLVLVLTVSFFPMASLAEDAAGVYAENLLQLPEGYQVAAISQQPDGALAAAAYNGQAGWALLTWRDTNAEPEILPLSYEGNDIEHIAVAPDGSIVAALSVMPSRNQQQAQGGQVKFGGDAPAGDAPQGGDGPTLQAGGEAPQGAQGGEMKRIMRGPEDMKTVLVWFDASGAEAARFEITGMVMHLAALPGHRAAMLSMMDGVISILDERGSEIQQLSVAMARTLAAHGETLYALTYDRKLIAFDAQSGQKISTAEVAEGFQITAAPDGALYLLDVSGIYSVDAASGALKKQMDAMGKLFGDPGNDVTGWVLLKDGSFAVLVNEGAGSGGGGGRTVRVGGESNQVLAVYSFSADADASRQDFTVTALRASAKLQKAAGDFQRLHPELNVKLQTQMSQDDDSPTLDYVRTLNTDLLAGKGGDVLVLDGLPIQKYIARGLLLDVADMFADVRLLPGVRSASLDGDGRMYAIPTQFTFDLLWGKQDVIDALSTLGELHNIPLQSGQTPLYARTPSDWLKLLYPASAASFADAQGKPSFDSPQFAQFLEALYQLYANQGEMPSDALEKGGSPMEFLEMINGATALYPMTVNGLMDLTMAYTISGEDQSGFSLPLSLSGESRVFTPSLMLGIGSQSKNAALAEEFIRLMLSPEVQQMEQERGLPTVSASLDKLFADAAERSGNENVVAMVSFDGGNPIELTFPDEAILERLRALCDTLDTAILPDDTLMGFIAEESEGFFAGRVSAEDTARAIEQRAWAYLNE